MTLDSGAIMLTELVGGQIPSRSTGLCWDTATNN